MDQNKVERPDLSNEKIFAIKIAFNLFDINVTKKWN